MLNKLWTAQYRYPGPDRVDITVKGQHPEWRQFAPSWNMVQGIKNGTMTELEYIEQYHKILTTIPDTGWDALLSMDEATLVCFCPSTAFCHRHILANYIIRSLGVAEWCGERPSPYA